MEKIVHLLVALRMYIKQYHWLAKGYENHILADKLEDDLTAYIDEGAELYSLTGEREALFADVVFEEARKHLQDAYSGEDMDLYLDNILKIMVGILSECEKVQNTDDKALKLGYSDFSGRLSNSILKKCYLIGLQRSK